MTIQNRDAFLENVASHLGRNRRTEGVERPKWSIQPQFDVFKDHSKDEMVDELEAICDVIHTDMKRTTKQNLHKTLHETFTDLNGKTVIASSDNRNVEFGLDTFYKNFESSGGHVHLWNEDMEEENRLVAERADIGIVFSDITLAESGTTVLFNNKYNGRAISLLPHSYVALIPKSTIVPRMTQATKMIHERNLAGDDVASCVSFVTGPSNSADIEMKLIVGVHGPVTATYILIEDA